MPDSAAVTDPQPATSYDAHDDGLLPADATSVCLDDDYYDVTADEVAVSGWLIYVLTALSTQLLNCMGCSGSGDSLQYRLEEGVLPLFQVITHPDTTHDHNLNVHILGFQQHVNKVHLHSHLYTVFCLLP